MSNDIHQIARHTLRGLFGMNGIGDDLRQQWLNSIAEFQAQRDALAQAEQDLYSVYDIAIQDTTDAAEWGKNLDRVHTAKNTMDNIAGAVASIADYWQRATGTISDLSHDNVIYDASNTALQTITGNPYDSIGTWLYNITHSSGLNGARRDVSRGMRRNGALGSLGLAPLVFPITLGALAIVVGVAAAAVASVTAYITYVNTKKDRYTQLVNDGMSPQDALQAATAEAQATSGYSFGSSVTKIAGMALVGVLVMTFGPALMRGRK